MQQYRTKTVIKCTQWLFHLPHMVTTSDWVGFPSATLANNICQTKQDKNGNNISHSGNNICHIASNGLTQQIKMATTSAIVAKTSATQQHNGNNISQPGNKICQRNTILPQCGTISATTVQLVPSTNKQWQ